MYLLRRDVPKIVVTTKPLRSTRHENKIIRIIICGVNELDNLAPPSSVPVELVPLVAAMVENIVPTIILSKNRFISICYF